MNFKKFKDIGGNLPFLKLDKRKSHKTSDRDDTQKPVETIDFSFINLERRIGTPIGNAFQDVLSNNDGDFQKKLEQEEYFNTLGDDDKSNTTSEQKQFPKKKDSSRIMFMEVPYEAAQNDSTYCESDSEYTNPSSINSSPVSSLSYFGQSPISTSTSASSSPVISRVNSATTITASSSPANASVISSPSQSTKNNQIWKRGSVSRRSDSLGSHNSRIESLKIAEPISSSRRNSSDNVIEHQQQYQQIENEQIISMMLDTQSKQETSPNSNTQTLGLSLMGDESSIIGSQATMKGGSICGSGSFVDLLGSFCSTTNSEDYTSQPSSYIDDSFDFHDSAESLELLLGTRSSYSELAKKNIIKSK
jgi:hypothetical protein